MCTLLIFLICQPQFSLPPILPLPVSDMSVAWAISGVTEKDHDLPLVHECGFLEPIPYGGTPCLASKMYVFLLSMVT